MGLLKVLLFRKYLGVKDTNLANIMVSPSTGSLLSVDENPYSAEELVKTPQRRGASLVTAQRMSMKVLGAAADAILNDSLQVAQFIRLLQSSSVDARCDITTATVHTSILIYISLL